MNDFPRITFGIIVLNGEPFVRYNLRALYPFAHQIIVVEGAALGAAGVASPEGHSTDGTLETLRDFKANEDPEDKVTIVTAENEGHPDGFWPGEKHEMSQVYAKRATGDYLWQVDVDEFYRARDMQRVLDMLRDDPDITAVSFKTLTFWGGFDYLVDSWYLRRGAEIFHRLFRWGEDYEYVTHRPPTVKEPSGQNMRNIRWIDGYALAKESIMLYHYALVFPKQVFNKCEYYKSANWAKKRGTSQWAKDVFLKLKKPYRIHNAYEYPGWLEYFRGTHPCQIEVMQDDIVLGRVEIDTRSVYDIENLLSSFWYFLGRESLKIAEPVDRLFRKGEKITRRNVRRLSNHSRRFIENPIEELEKIRERLLDCDY